MTRVILQSQRKNPTATGDFTLILNSIQLACKTISTAVRRAGINRLIGSLTSENVTGDTQKKLDVLSNDCFVNALKFSTKIAVMASEEETDVYIVEDCQDGKYVIAFDPLDGSSNIDVNVSIGSIFGIWRRADVHAPGSRADLLRSGNDVMAAGYCVYGSSTQMVLALGGGEVNGYTLDPSIGEFILTHPNMRIPAKGTYYSINEGNSKFWDEAITNYVHSKKYPETGNPYSLRYVGSMVSDVHRTIIYGGVFLYPGDKKAPSGKLRVLYEVFPLSFVIEQAGGKASTGRGRTLDLVPTEIHQRSPVILGSASEVELVEDFYRRFPGQ
jgi:fructose-1,6-bisphosphatase I